MNTTTVSMVAVLLIAGIFSQCYARPYVSTVTNAHTTTVNGHGATSAGHNHVVTAGLGRVGTVGNTHSAAVNPYATNAHNTHHVGNVGIGGATHTVSGVHHNIVH